jgi:alpha-L-fucosidase 2
MLVHTRLLEYGRDPDLPDISRFLAEARDLVLSHRYREADDLFKKALLDAGYDPVLSTPLPLCDLLLDSASSRGFSRYRRTLSPERGECIVSYDDGPDSIRRRCFCSRADNVFVMELENRTGLLPGTEITLRMHERGMCRNVPHLAVDPVCHATDNLLVYEGTNLDGAAFGAVAIVHADKVSVGGAGSLVVSDVPSVLLVVVPFVKGDPIEDSAAAVQKARSISASYGQLSDAHLRLHVPLYGSSDLTLCDEADQQDNEHLLLEAYEGTPSPLLIEKMWHFGRHLLLSSSAPGGNPCHLYGLWCGDYRALFAFNMVNVNLQMIYWQAYSSNMPSLLLPVFDCFERLLPDFRKNARNLFGCRGIFVPANTMPDSGLLKQVSPHIIYWTAGAGWVANLFYDYYLFTDDRTFLAERAMPFMQEVALFYRDFFVIGEDGTYVSAPSVSPENTPANFLGEGDDMQVMMETTANATMDFAIAKELLSNLVEGARLLSWPQDEMAGWEEMLRHIPSYRVNGDGAICEWMDPYLKDNYHHRHQSHLYPMFPGYEIRKADHHPLYPAFERAIGKRLEIGIGEQTGWSLAYMACVYARMGLGDEALECLALMTRSTVQDNLVTVHNDWRGMGIGVEFPPCPVQIDANAGLVQAVDEMLLQSYGRTVSVLPALPSRWPKGSVRHLRTRQALLVSVSWDEAVTDVTIENDTDRDATVSVLVMGAVREQVLSVPAHGRQERRYASTAGTIDDKDSGTRQEAGT